MKYCVVILVINNIMVTVCSFICFSAISHACKGYRKVVNIQSIQLLVQLAFCSYVCAVRYIGKNLDGKVQVRRRFALKQDENEEVKAQRRRNPKRKAMCAQCSLRKLITQLQQNCFKFNPCLQLMDDIKANTKTPRDPFFFLSTNKIN